MRVSIFSAEEFEEELGGSEDPSQLAEVNQDLSEGLDEMDDASEAVAVAADETESLSDVKEVVDEAVESGEGLSEESIRALRIAVEAICRRTQYPVELGTKMFSAENFSNDSTRLANTKQLKASLEDESQGIFMRFWEAIMRFFAKLVDMGASLISKMFNWNRAMIRAVNALDARVAAAKKNGLVPKKEIEFKVSAKNAFGVTRNKGDFSYAAASKAIDATVAANKLASAGFTKGANDVQALTSAFGDDNKLSSTSIEIPEDSARVSGSGAVIVSGGSSRDGGRLFFVGNTYVDVIPRPALKYAGKIYYGLEVSISTTPIDHSGRTIDFNEADSVTVKSVATLDELSKYTETLKKLINGVNSSNKEAEKVTTALKDFNKEIQGLNDHADTDKAEEKKKLLNNRKAVARGLKAIGGGLSNLVSYSSRGVQGAVRWGMWYVNQNLGQYIKQK